jgi:hypothetical protein
MVCSSVARRVSVAEHHDGVFGRWERQAGDLVLDDEHRAHRWRTADSDTRTDISLAPARSVRSRNRTRRTCMEPIATSENPTAIWCRRIDSLFRQLPVEQCRQDRAMHSMNFVSTPGTSTYRRYISGCASVYSTVSTSLPHASACRSASTYLWDGLIEPAGGRRSLRGRRGGAQTDLR